MGGRPTGPGPTTSSSQPPADLVELAGRRRAAREARDFATADAVRADIEARGWRVVDGPEGTRLERLLLRETYDSPATVPSLHDEPSLCVHSVCLAYHGWPEDVGRLVSALIEGTGPGAGSLEVILGGGPGAEDPTEVLEMAHPALARPPVLVSTLREAGHAERLNSAARRARGEVVHFVEPSLEFGSGVLETARQELADPAVGACGPFGLATSDWRDFQPTDSLEPAALEYLLSVRRSDIGRIGEMDPGFRFYRNLDIDYSRQVMAAGLRLRRYQATVRRHEHRLWESTSPEDRERLSRRNFNRVLERWVRPPGPAS